MKKTHFVERQGDWICMRCKNLNFSFRVICNRCKILKGESDLLYDEHLQNVYNIFQFNEMMLQKNFLLNQGKISNSIINSNLFSFNNSYNPSQIQTQQFLKEK